MLWAWFIVLVLVLFDGLIPFSYLRPNPSQAMLTKLARVEMQILASAMEDYRTALGAYPIGDNATILKQLMGTNSMKKVFFNQHPRSLDATGAFVDPWQSPYYGAFFKSS